MSVEICFLRALPRVEPLDHVAGLVFVSFLRTGQLSEEVVV